jgi:hypothetical protein
VNINDYLIDQRGKDWAKLLSVWSGLLPEYFTLWLVNRFGDLFVVLDDGSVHMLDVGHASLKRLADSRDQFAELLDVDNNANTWLMIPLVDKCVRALPALKPSQCYGYKNPPLLGGKYAVENCAALEIAEHYSFLAHIHEQTKDLPEGAQVRLTTVD